MPGVGVVVHHPEALLDEVALQRRVLAEVRDQLLQHVGVEDRALHVLRARDIRRARSAAPSGRAWPACSAAALPAMPAPTTIASKLSSIMAISFSSRSGRGVCGDRRLRNASVSAGSNLHRVADDAEMGEVEDRRVLVGVDRDDQVGALDADAMLDGAGDAGGDVELRPDGLAGLADLAVGRDPALLHQRARAAKFGAEHRGEMPHQLEVLRRSAGPGRRRPRRRR